MEVLSQLPAAISKLKTRVQLTGLIVVAIVLLTAYFYQDGSPSLPVLLVCFFSGFIFVFFGYFVNALEQFRGKGKLYFSLVVFCMTVLAFVFLIYTTINVVAATELSREASRIDDEIRYLSVEKTIKGYRLQLENLLGNPRSTDHQLKEVKSDLINANKRKTALLSKPHEYARRSGEKLALRNSIRSLRSELSDAFNQNDQEKIYRLTNQYVSSLKSELGATFFFNRSLRS